MALKNVLLSCGAFALAGLFHLPLVWLWSAVSNRASFTVGIETMLLMPLVMGLPEILVACGAGAAVAATAESRYPSRWSLIPAGLSVLQRVFARRWWAQPPGLEDQVAVVIEAAVPAVACVLTATLLERRWSSGDPRPSTPLAPTTDAPSQRC